LINWTLILKSGEERWQRMECRTYKRYEFTSDGISFRALPGQPEMMHNEDSDEHNEKGDVVSDAITDPYIRKLAMERG